MKCKKSGVFEKKSLLDILLAILLRNLCSFFHGHKHDDPQPGQGVNKIQLLFYISKTLIFFVQGRRVSQEMRTREYQTCLRGGYNSGLSTSHPKFHGIVLYKCTNIFFARLVAG